MRYKRATLHLGLCLPALVWSQNGLAQAVPEATQSPADAASTQADNQLGDIIVTAQKRSESVNDVPLSITAIGGDNLKKLGVDSTEDLVKIIPALSVAKSQNNTPIYTLRGVGFQTQNLTSSSPVGVYVDEISYTYPYLASDVSFDLERVEVLKGPQGTLYGRSTTGGLVNYITARPSSTPSGSFSLTAGNYQSYGVEGYATGPLTDTLSIRLAGKVDLSEKGWQRSVTRPADRLGKKNQMAGRASLLWEPDPRFKAFLSISYWRDRSDTQAPQSIAYSPQVPPFSQAARAQPSVIAEPQNSRDADWNSTNYQTTPGLIRPSYEADGRFFGASLRLDYKFGDWATLTSLTGYNDAKRDDVTSVDGLAIEVLTARNSGRIKSFSQELRLSGDAPRLHWLIGGYYSNDDLYEKTLSYFADATAAFQIRGTSLLLKTDPAAAAAMLGVPGPAVPGFIALAGANTAPYSVSDLANGFNRSQFFADGRNRTYAAFGNATYEISDRLNATLGARYTSESLRNSGCVANIQNTTAAIVPFLGTLVFQKPTAAGANDCTTALPDNSDFSGIVRGNLSQNNVSLRGTLDYHVGRDFLIYATVARGYKGGAFPAVAANNASQLTPVKQERLMAYELGVKASLLDRHVQANFSTYYYDYKDKQLYNRIPDFIFGTLPTIVNVPKSEVYGAEAEITVRPVSGLDVRLAGSYLHTEVKNFSGFDEFGAPFDFSGKPFAYSPKWSGSASVGYHRDIVPGLQGFININGSYQSRSNASLTQVAIYTIKPRTLVDATLGVSKESWELRLWAKNLFDTYYWNTVNTQTDSIFRYAGMPRTFGITATLRY